MPMHVWKASRYNTVRLHVSHTLLKGLPTPKLALTHTDDIQSQVQVVHIVWYTLKAQCAILFLCIFVLLYMHCMYIKWYCLNPP